MAGAFCSLHAADAKREPGQRGAQGNTMLHKLLVHASLIGAFLLPQSVIKRYFGEVMGEATVVSEEGRMQKGGNSGTFQEKRMRERGHL